MLAQNPAEIPQVPPVIDVSTGVANGPPEWMAPVIAITTIAVVVAVILLFRPIFRAWARRIEGSVGDPAVTEELHSLRERVNELEINSARVHELEERLDFAERLLAQRDDAARLPRDGRL